MCTLLETKIRLAESVRDEVCGHFMWPLTTHENPGRTVGDQGEQARDGFRALDRIGPANNKGLFTLWGEPLDAFYLYRSNYAPAKTQPMVYIVSHTWPDRWTTPGKKSGIVVYSNCDEVELFNDDGQRSLGRRTRGPKGSHFQWDDVEILYNELSAEGRVGGRVVATDRIRLHHLPAPPAAIGKIRVQPADDPVIPLPGRNYLYRVNCGGPDYTDHLGHRWLADRDFSPGDAWGSLSWASDYPDFSPAFGSQRKIYDPIAGTADEALFQTFRYGRDRLRYLFAVPDGDYTVELLFTEPWYGTGGGLDCTGWRLSDVAINGETRLKNLDLWREAGRATAVKKILPARARAGRLEILFPSVAAGQAVVSAIAISSANPTLNPPPGPASLVQNLRVADAIHAAAYAVCTHLDNGDSLYGDADGAFDAVPPELLDATWIRTASASRDFAGPELLRFDVMWPATSAALASCPGSPIGTTPDSRSPSLVPPPPRSGFSTTLRLPARKSCSARTRHPLLSVTRCMSCCLHGGYHRHRPPRSKSFRSTARPGAPSAACAPAVPSIATTGNRLGQRSRQRWQTATGSKRSRVPRGASTHNLPSPITWKFMSRSTRVKHDGPIGWRIGSTPI